MVVAVTHVDLSVLSNGDRTLGIVAGPRGIEVELARLATLAAPTPDDSTIGTDLGHVIRPIGDVDVASRADGQAERPVELEIAAECRATTLNGSGNAADGLAIGVGAFDGATEARTCGCATTAEPSPPIAYTEPLVVAANTIPRATAMQHCCPPTTEDCQNMLPVAASIA